MLVDFPATATFLTPAERADGLLYPRVERIREISAHIALSVIRAAQRDGADRAPDLRAMACPELLAFVQERMWNP